MPAHAIKVVLPTPPAPSARAQRPDSDGRWQKSLRSETEPSAAKAAGPRPPAAPAAPAPRSVAGRPAALPGKAGLIAAAPLNKTSLAFGADPAMPATTRLPPARPGSAQPGVETAAPTAEGRDGKQPVRSGPGQAIAAAPSVPAVVAGVVPLPVSPLAVSALAGSSPIVAPRFGPVSPKPGLRSPTAAVDIATATPTATLSRHAAGDAPAPALPTGPTAGSKAALVPLSGSARNAAAPDSARDAAPAAPPPAMAILAPPASATHADAPAPLLATGPLAAPAQQLGPVLIALAASTAAPGSQKLVLQLSPSELGRVQITVERSADGTATINVTTERPETFALLRADSAQLHQALDGAGLGRAGRELTFHLAAAAAPGLQPQALHPGAEQAALTAASLPAATPPPHSLAPATAGQEQAQPAPSFGFGQFGGQANQNGANPQCQPNAPTGPGPFLEATAPGVITLRHLPAAAGLDITA